MQQHQPSCPNRRLSSIVLCVAICLLTFSPKVFGQTTSNPNKEGFTCGLVPSEPAFVQVEIVDKSGAPVVNLKISDFLIWEDGVKQTPDFIKEQRNTVAGKDMVWYRVGYYPTNGKLDGTFRTIRIDVQGREKRGLSGLYWPNGYFAKMLGK